MTRLTDISGPQVSHFLSSAFGAERRPFFFARPSPRPEQAGADGRQVEIASLDRIENDRADWNDLAARALEPNIFLDPAFALAAASNLAGATPEFLMVWERDATMRRRLIGVWPILRLDRWRRAKIAGWMHDYCCSGAPLLDRDRAPAALEALIGELRFLDPAAAVLIFDQLRRDGATFALLSDFARRKGLALAQFAEHERAALAADAPGASACLASRKKLKELRRQTRRLRDHGPVTYGVACGGAALDHQIEAFLQLEAKGWKGRSGGAFLNRRGHAAFLRCMAKAMGEHGRLRIHWMACGEQLVASNIVLFGGGGAFFWKTAYDEAFAFASPGVLLTLRMTEDLLREPGLRFLDSCAVSGHPMIDHLWRDRAPMAGVMIALGQDKAPGFARALRRERWRRKLRRIAKSAWMRIGFG